MCQRQSSPQIYPRSGRPQRAVPSCVGRPARKSSISCLFCATTLAAALMRSCRSHSETSLKRVGISAMRSTTAEHVSFNISKQMTAEPFPLGCRIDNDPVRLPGDYGQGHSSEALRPLWIQEVSHADSIHLKPRYEIPRTGLFDHGFLLPLWPAIVFLYVAKQISSGCPSGLKTLHQPILHT